MDSVPAADRRPHLGVLTALAGVVLLAFGALVLWLSDGGARLDGVEEELVFRGDDLGASLSMVLVLRD